MTKCLLCFYTYIFSYLAINTITSIKSSAFYRIWLSKNYKSYLYHIYIYIYIYNILYIYTLTECIYISEFMGYKKCVCDIEILR